MTLHLHHVEYTPGGTSAELACEEAERAVRAARHAATIAWDNVRDDLCFGLNLAAHQIEEAVAKERVK